MTLLTLSQAAKAAKKSKSTLHEAIHSGRLSAVRNDKNQWQVDQDELFRIYPKNELKTNNKSESFPSRTNDTIAVLQQQIESLEQRLIDVKNERDDLRCRLNEEVEERRKLTAWMTKAIDNQDSSLSMIFGLTTLQYSNFTKLLRGTDLLIAHYPRHNLMSSHKLSNTPMSNYLQETGALQSGQFSEKFKQIADSILNGRNFKDITIYDVLNIAKQYTV